MRVVYSDASEVVYGGYIVGVGGEVAHENWSLEESEELHMERVSYSQADAASICDQPY